jgi:hypothetical protein
MQMLPKSDDDRSPSPEIRRELPDSGMTPSGRVRSGRIRSFWPDLGRISGRIRSDQAGFRPFWPDPAGSVAGSGHIRPDSGHVGQIRPDQCPDPVIFGRIPSILARSGRISVRIWSDQAGFRPFWPDPAGSVSGSGQIRPDSGRFLSMTGFRRHSAQLPDVVGFRRPAVFRWPDSGGRQYSGGRIPTPALFQ